MGSIKPLHSLAKHKGGGEGKKGEEEAAAAEGATDVRACACARAHLSVECRGGRGGGIVPTERVAAGR